MAFLKANSRSIPIVFVGFLFDFESRGGIWDILMLLMAWATVLSYFMKSPKELLLNRTASFMHFVIFMYLHMNRVYSASPSMGCSVSNAS